MATRFDGNIQITGSLQAKSIIIPDGFYLSVGNTQHRNVKTYQQAGGADVVAASSYVYTAAAAGKLSGVDVFVDTPPAGGDKGYTLDVKKSTAGGAFTTVLSSLVTVNSSTSLRSVVAAVIASVAYVGGDSFKVDVALIGSTGSRGQGVLVTLTFDEEAA